MGTISLAKQDHLYWLGRYTERVYTTLRVFADYYDRMIDRDAFAYVAYCECLAIPNIYQDKEQFTDSYLFEETNPDSMYANLTRAFDNGVVIRESISSTALSYLQMSLDILRTARGSRAPLMELQRVMDDLLAFWGSVDDFVEDEYTRNVIKCGKYVERLDLYLRFGFSAGELEKELAKLTHRMRKVDLGDYADQMAELGELFAPKEGPDLRLQALWKLEHLDEAIIQEQNRISQ